MTAIVNITCENDADFYRSFNYVTVDGDPIDITGSALRMGVRRHAADVAEQMLLTTENGGLAIVNGPAGNFTVKMTQGQLVRMQTGDYEHSLILIDGASKTPIWSGALTINAGPSR
ncbi:hypothetical protein I6F35_06265 [Bradyrhizobium sp. BRP22]|uniref:hypothetical protein n=1 Tax=Bradyrhizobium sp. BRP22 TaxID=2793821 RepID=UPI001CD27C00|nr:hypothetical protein [Bradyrhizobium sp. BRP22]MCA1452824.1 hypothetical protein [Bradyrhizobium sp. BRP22]